MFIRNDNKVRALLVFDNGDTACYIASWDDQQGNTHSRLTSCTSTRFNREFSRQG